MFQAPRPSTTCLLSHFQSPPLIQSLSGSMVVLAALQCLVSSPSMALTSSMMVKQSSSLTHGPGINRHHFSILRALLVSVSHLQTPQLIFFIQISLRVKMPLLVLETSIMHSLKNVVTLFMLPVRAMLEFMVPI